MRSKKLSSDERRLVFGPLLVEVLQGVVGRKPVKLTGVVRLLAQRVNINDLLDFFGDVFDEFREHVGRHKDLPLIPPSFVSPGSLSETPLAPSSSPASVEQPALASLVVEGQEEETSSSPGTPAVGSEPDAPPTEGVTLPAPATSSVVAMLVAGTVVVPKVDTSGAEPPLVSTEALEKSDGHHLDP